MSGEAAYLPVKGSSHNCGTSFTGENNELGISDWLVTISSWTSPFLGSSKASFMRVKLLQETCEPRALWAGVVLRVLLSPFKLNPRRDSSAKSWSNRLGLIFASDRAAHIIFGQSRILTEIGSNICPPSPSSEATRLEDGDPNNSMIPSRLPLDSSRGRLPCGCEIMRENFH
ncbi:hypothetical protein YC2023_024135 [Brassica napus]